MTLSLAPAERLRPAPAPVTKLSDFEPVAAARPLSWSAIPSGPEPEGSGRIEVSLSGRWERWADVDGDPSFPARGARAQAGPPTGVTWRKLTVPENFGFDEELSRQYAPVWYKRTFADPRHGGLPESPSRVRLRFEAVDYLADVWLNGEHLGHHEGYFAPFGFDVTDRLSKDNTVVVAVQDPLEPLDPSALFFEHRKRVIKGTLKYHDSRPGGLPGRMVGPLVDGDDPWVWTPEWGQSKTTGGIVGAVTLERTGDVSLDALFVTPVDLRTVQIAAVVTNHTPDELVRRLELALGDERAQLEMRVPPGSGRVDAVTELDPDRFPPWEPVGSPAGAPVVHELRAALATADGKAIDRRAARFGLRTAEVVTDDGGHARHLVVNGRAVFVKAVNYIPWQHFAEVGRSFYDRDMRMLIDAHGNSVGVHAHIQSPHCYEAADDAGVLVFQDFALQWSYDSGTETNPGFVDIARRQIAEMAYLLHNHPSVVYYACHNEPARMFDPRRAENSPETDQGETHLDAALDSTLRAVDIGRHVHEASGIGDDVHNYAGSLTGGSIYRVRERPAWFVSEYGFWAVGPQADKFGDRGWPPDAEQMTEWVSRLSFIGSTCAFAGLPSRYSSLHEWAAATQAYGAALAKYETEWFRAHRGDPFMGYRWHFWADWWGYAGGGLVDVERVPKTTYDAFRDASRPLLLVGVHDASVVPAGDIAVPIVAVNDRGEPWHGSLGWEVVEATSGVFAPDFDGARIGLPMPPDAEARVAVPRSRGATVARGELTVDARACAATPVGEADVELAPGEARTLLLRWTDPELGEQENFVHLHCPADGEEHAPGLTEVRARREGV
jgi:beta-mannosidase